MTKSMSIIRAGLELESRLRPAFQLCQRIAH